MVQANRIPIDDVAMASARVKIEQKVDILLQRGRLDLDTLQRQTQQAYERLLFQLPGLRAAHDKRMADHRRSEDHGRGTRSPVPSMTTAHAKAERQLLTLELQLSVLRDRQEQAARDRAEGLLRAAAQNAEYEEKQLLAQFRQEEAQKAAKEEHTRFLAWKENLGL
jgi:hypothetical protein